MKIKALKKEPFGQWRAIKVENSPEAIKKLIGCETETVEAGHNCYMVCSEHHGVLRGDNTWYNTVVNYRKVFGPILLFGKDGENLTDVPAALVQELEGKNCEV